MAVQTINRTCKFAGYIPLPISRIADTVGTQQTDPFDGISLFACTSRGHWDGANWVGHSGCIFDNATGVTNFDLGNTAIATNSNWGGGMFDAYNLKIKGMIKPVLGLSGANTILSQSTVPIVPGVALVAALNPVVLFNTGAGGLWPASRTSGGMWPCINGGNGSICVWDGAAGSGGIQISSWDDAGVFTNLGLKNQIVNTGSSFTATNVIPWMGKNYLTVQPSAGNGQIWESLFLNSSIQYMMDFESPDGVLDMNVILNQGTALTSRQISTMGYLFLDKTTRVIAGKTFLGLGYLIQPDGKRYWIVNILPVDAAAAAWNGTGSSTWAMDRNGFVYFKRLNSPTQLYKSNVAMAPTQLLINPILPVISVPHVNGLHK